MKITKTNEPEIVRTWTLVCTRGGVNILVQLVPWTCTSNPFLEVQTIQQVDVLSAIRPSMKVFPDFFSTADQF